MFLCRNFWQTRASLSSFSKSRFVSLLVVMILTANSCFVFRETHFFTTENAPFPTSSRISYRSVNISHLCRRYSEHSDAINSPELFAPVIKEFHENPVLSINKRTLLCSRIECRNILIRTLGVDFGTTS